MKPLIGANAQVVQARHCFQWNDRRARTHSAHERIWRYMAARITKADTRASARKWRAYSKRKRVAQKRLGVNLSAKPNVLQRRAKATSSPRPTLYKSRNSTVTKRQRTLDSLGARMRVHRTRLKRQAFTVMLDENPLPLNSKRGLRLKILKGALLNHFRDLVALF